jgi:deoxyadenosine/deoxycytidine kinase
MAGPFSPACVDADRALTMQLLEGQRLAFEGVPFVGKTTLMRSLEHGCASDALRFDMRYEAEDTEMLRQFLRNPREYAFMFQMFKLRGRQLRALQHEHDLVLRRRPPGVCVAEDRDLPGDAMFALYNHAEGNISGAQLDAYMSELRATAYHTPFLTLYLTAQPATLRARAVAGGTDDDVVYYTEERFRAMDQHHRDAFALCRCPYVEVDWDAQLAHVGSLRASDWASRTLVEPDECWRVLETGLVKTYGSNMARLRAGAEIKMSLSV